MKPLKGQTRLIPIFFIILFEVLPAKSPAQQVKKIYYSNSRRPYSIENWDKRRTKAHFTLYFEDGQLKAEGCKKLDNKYHRVEEPDSFFNAYGHSGHLLQEMRMTNDSVVVNTYDSLGSLRGIIRASAHYCYEEQLFMNGRTMVRLECKLPDSNSYFKDYFKYPATFSQANKNLRWPAPLFPINYGEAGNDGVSPPGTFKIYFNAADRIQGSNRGFCSAVFFYPDGKILSVEPDVWSQRPRRKNYSPDGREDNDTTRQFYANGQVKELSYTDSAIGLFVTNLWHENATPSVKSYCILFPNNRDSSAHVEEFRILANREDAPCAAEMEFDRNGRLSAHRAAFIAAAYDSSGNLIDETLSKLTIGSGERYSTSINTTGLIHKGQFKEGVRDGVWEAFYPNAPHQLCYRVTYNHGYLNGNAVVNDTLGRLLLHCFLNDGSYDGQLIKFNNGDTAEIDNYRNRLPDGLWYHYYDGKLNHIDSFHYSSGKLFGSNLLSFHRDPYYKESERVYRSENDYTDFYYYPNGTKHSETITNSTGSTTKHFDEDGTLIGK